MKIIHTNLYTRIATVFVFGVVFLSASIVSASDSQSVPLSISWVSTDKMQFNPERKEKIALRYKVSKPADVVINIIDAYNNVVKTDKRSITKVENQQFVWDGMNDKGQRVPPEAYYYTITATSASGKESVTYDLRDKTGGETIYPQNVSMDPKGRVKYSLSKPSRVRIIISSEGKYWPVRTLLDWAPKANGNQEDVWDGWDADHIINPLTTSTKFSPILYAFALPNNTIIVKGTPLSRKEMVKRESMLLRASNKKPEPIPERVESIRKKHFHATHPRERCYNPKIEARLTDEFQKTKKGLPKIDKTTAISLSISDKQEPGHARPLSRVSVFVYVDGLLTERLLVGYDPYQWIIDPSQFTPGEHIITGLFTWRGDHFGLVHKKVWIEPSK